MSLKKFSLPGKDSRCVLYDGRVYKIKTLMPPPAEGDLSEHIDNHTLQEEIEDIVRAVLAIPQTVDPRLMRTDHFIVKPERKEWKAPSKIDFKQHGQLQSAQPFMFVLNLKLIDHEKSTETQEIQTSSQEAEEFHSKKNENKRSKRPLHQEVSDEAASSPKSSKCPNRREATWQSQESSQTASNAESSTSSNRRTSTLRSEESSRPAPIINSSRRSNRRIAPSRSCTTTNSRSQPRRWAVRLSSAVRRGSSTTRFSPDEEVDVDGADGMVWDRQTGCRMSRERIGIERQRREGSPELESGFSRLVQGGAALGQDWQERGNESSKPGFGQSDLSSTGDQGPIPGRPSGGGGAAATAGAVVPTHPGSEIVEQHVLEEQMRLQAVASPGGDAPLQEAKGVVHRMIDAVITPVKNLFS